MLFPLVVCVYVVHAAFQDARKEKLWRMEIEDMLQKERDLAKRDSGQ